MESRKSHLTQDKGISLRDLLRPEDGEEILKVEWQSDDCGGNTDFLEVLLHHTFAVKVGHLQPAFRQLLHVLQAAVDDVAQTEALGQVSKPLALQEGRRRP